MKDVARLAGVSLKTVSRVLNGESGVTPAKVDSVRRAATELGFRRNEVAATLRRTGQRTHSVGLVIEDVANPFYSALARAVERVARDHHRLLLVGSSAENPDRERELIGAFCARRVDGLIVVPAGGSHDYLTAELAVGTPVVFVDRPPKDIQVDTVLSANRLGASTGVTHLVGHGHRRVAFLGDDPDIVTAHERFLGYRDALTAAAIPVDDALVCRGLSDAPAAEAATTALLTAATPPTALFTGNNLITVGALRALRSLRPLPHPPALIGFDDFDLADLLDPPVTVIAQDAHALGLAAARLLFGRLDGDTAPPRTITLPTTLVPRGSGEIPPPPH
jgi:LacI family transcriptional regulator